MKLTSLRLPRLDVIAGRRPTRLQGQGMLALHLKTFRTEVKDGQVLIDLGNPAPSAA
jgi:hypothetical protein